MNRLKDSIWIGIPAGLIGPLIGVLGFYFANFSNSPITQFFKLATAENLLSPLLSLCAVINLGIFYIFIHFNHLLTARGIILSTFVYGVAIVILKFELFKL
ncbi:MAG: hypothetical protein IT246_08585 [Bacteroidia bacterium]|nr:hypothetical protein [Bacteroidia bacterium]